MKTDDIKETKVDISKGPPETSCPHCGKKFIGWKLKQMIGKVDDCDECGGKIRYV